MTNPDLLKEILKDSNYHLGLFTPEEIDALRQKVSVREYRKKQTAFVNCIVREKEIQLKPEEVVRQLYAARLINTYGYPKSRLAFEYSVVFGRQKKKADIVIFDKNRPDAPYIVVEIIWVCFK